MLGLVAVGLVWMAAAAGQAVLPDGGPVAARAALDGGRWAEAEAGARRYLAAHPGSAEGMYLLGAALFRENRPKESLETFTRAAAVARPSALDLRLVAMDYVLLGDFDDADRWMTRSAEENPRDGETWYAMGRIRQTENRFGEAVACFQRSLALVPRSVKAENNLGLAYEGMNRPEEAMAAYRQALAWQQGAAHPSEQPGLNLGILLADRNQLDEALGVLKGAEALAPEDPKIHGALGKLYARRGELAPAAAELERAAAGEPNEAAWHFQLGQVYRREGMAERARAELARAAALEGAGRR